MIEFIFDAPKGNVVINERVYEINDYKILIEVSNWNLLRFNSNQSLKIIDCKINNNSINFFLLIMYKDDQTCCFGHIDPGSTSFLPVHNNYATFVSEVYSQLTNGWFGKQIYQYFNFSFDSGTDIGDEYPTHIKDYFNTPTGPHWLEKYNPQSAWFLGPEIDIEHLTQELSTVDVPEAVPGTGEMYMHWTMRHIKDPDLSSLGLTYLNQIANDAGFTYIDTLSFNSLDSGGYIGMHRDGSIFKSRKKLYINLTPSNLVTFKFAKAGCVPMNTTNAVWVNTDNYVHAVVNNSTQTRNIVSLSGEAVWPAVKH